MYEADKLNYSVLLWEAVSDLLENTEDLRGGRSQYYCSIWKLTFIYVDHFFNIYSVLYEADKLNYSVLLEADSDLLETIESMYWRMWGEASIAAVCCILYIYSI